VPIEPSSNDELTRLEALLVDFDLHWSPDRLEAAAKQLANSPARVRTLCELVKIDFERKWRSGEPIALGDYCERFPELRVNGQTSTDLVAAIEEIQREPREATASAALNTPMRSSSVHLPKEFGRYRIVRPLGRGGMGGVYLAKDMELDRRVALKVPRFRADDAELFERFAREARAAAAIEHPGICRVYDVGRIDGLPYLTMSYVEGPSLLEELKHGPLPVRQAVAWTRDIARAMADAHRLGVIHRDLKPANILLAKSERTPVVTDFGLARRDSPGDTALTAEGMVVGTPIYMSPEQISSDRVGPASDIYSLGVVLYEMLTGKPPFEGTRTEIFANALAKTAVAPSSTRRELDAGLDAIVARALAKKSTDRFSSMTEFANALDAWLEPPRPRPAASSRRRTLGAVALVALGVAVVAMALAGIFARRDSPTNGTPNNSDLGTPTLEIERPFAADVAPFAISFFDDRVVQTAVRDKAKRLQVSFWDSATGGSARPALPPEPRDWITFSPDGRSFLVGGGGYLHAELKSTKAGELLQRWTTGKLTLCAAWSADGKFIAIAVNLPPRGYRVRTFELRTEKFVDNFVGHNSDIHCVALSDGAEWVYSASDDHHSLRGVRTNRLEREAGNNAVRSAAFIPKEGTVVIGYETGELVRLNGLTETEWAPKHGDAVHCLAVTPDSKTIVSGSRNGSVWGWNPETGELRWQLSNLPGPVIALALSSDGKRLAVAAGMVWQVWRLP
jgi:serine/threonine protein kinase